MAYRLKHTALQVQVAHGLCARELRLGALSRVDATLVDWRGHALVLFARVTRARVAVVALLVARAAVGNGSVVATVVVQARVHGARIVVFAPSVVATTTQNGTLDARAGLLVAECLHARKLWLGAIGGVGATHTGAFVDALVLPTRGHRARVAASALVNRLAAIGHLVWHARPVHTLGGHARRRVGVVTIGDGDATTRVWRELALVVHASNDVDAIGRRRAVFLRLAAIVNVGGHVGALVVHTQRAAAHVGAGFTLVLGRTAGGVICAAADVAAVDLQVAEALFTRVAGQRALGVVVAAPLVAAVHAKATHAHVDCARLPVVTLVGQLAAAMLGAQLVATRLVAVHDGVLLGVQRLVGRRVVQLGHTPAVLTHFVHTAATVGRQHTAYLRWRSLCVTVGLDVEHGGRMHMHRTSKLHTHATGLLRVTLLGKGKRAQRRHRVLTRRVARTTAADAGSAKSGVRRAQTGHRGLARGVDHCDGAIAGQLQRRDSRATAGGVELAVFRVLVISIAELAILGHSAAVARSIGTRSASATAHAAAVVLLVAAVHAVAPDATQRSTAIGSCRRVQRPRQHWSRWLAIVGAVPHHREHVVVLAGQIVQRLAAIKWRRQKRVAGRNGPCLAQLGAAQPIAKPRATHVAARSATVQFVQTRGALGNWIQCAH